MVLLRNARWLLSSRNGAFLISSAQLVRKEALFRWDLDFLAPHNESARQSMKCIPAYLAQTRKEISWRQRFCPSLGLASSPIRRRLIPHQKSAIASPRFSDSSTMATAVQNKNSLESDLCVGWNSRQSCAFNCGSAKSQLKMSA